MMNGWIQRMDERLYPGVGKNWDDELFRERILERVGPGTHLLDLGAGAGIVQAMNFRGDVGRACGVDPDPRVVENPNLHEGRVGVGEEIPWEDASFDMVVADNVLEHLDSPEQVFAEVARVLRPGGRFLAKTPNKRHYMPLIARLTPHRFHQWVNRRRGRDEDDTFPTRYRANCPADVARHAAAVGLEVASVELVEGRPEYLRMSPPTYLAGWAYERVVNRFDALASLRVLMVVELRKPGRSVVMVPAAAAATPARPEPERVAV